MTIINTLRTVGTDISPYDSYIDFSLADVEIDFCIHKISEGISWPLAYPDKIAMIDENWARAKAQHIPSSVYHFFIPALDIPAQIQHFLNRLGNRAVDFPVCIDVESHPYYPNLSAQETRTRLRAFLDAVETAVGHTPIIYTAAWYWNSVVAGNNPQNVTWASDYPLWVANYRNISTFSDIQNPLLPMGWSNWKFWQVSSIAEIPGVVPGAEDLDLFNGDRSLFQAYLQQFNPNVDNRATLRYEAINNLNVRSGPSTSTPIVRTMPAGTEFEIVNFAGQEAWAELKDGGFVAIRFNSNFLATKIEPNA